MSDEASDEYEQEEITFEPVVIKCGVVEITENQIVVDGVKQEYVTDFAIHGSARDVTRLTITRIIDERVTKQGGSDA